MNHKSCYQLKGSLFTLTVLQLYHNDLNCLEKELSLQVEQAPNFFNHTPVVIDLHELAQNQLDIDFKQLKKIICSLRMIPVGVKGSTLEQQPSIDEAGLAILAEAKSASRPKAVHETPADALSDQPNTADSPEQPDTIATPSPSDEVHQDTPQIVSQNTRVIRKTIRSGQQFYAADGDLVVIGSVSAGAEILADGNIHVYGSLRGKALAGVKGNPDACIFCHDLQSELISIAGIYLSCDDIPDEFMGQANEISLNQEKLTFQPLI